VVEVVPLGGKLGAEDVAGEQPLAEEELGGVAAGDAGVEVRTDALGVAEVQVLDPGRVAGPLNRGLEEADPEGGPTG